MNYIPKLYQADYNNPNVTYLAQKYINIYYIKVPNTEYVLGDYFEQIIQSLLKPNEFMLYSVEPDNINHLVGECQLPENLKTDLMDLIKMYVLCVPLNTILISSLMYKNSLLQYLIINDPYFSSQLLDYNVYNTFTEYINLPIKYDFYTAVAFNSLVEVFCQSYLELTNYGELLISPIYERHLVRFGEYISEVLISQGKTITKAYRYLQVIDDLFLTELKENNMSSGSLLLVEDYDSYLSIISSYHSNPIGIKYMINNFFTILTRNPSSRDTYEVVSIIRTRIREALFESTIDAPIEYTISYTMTPISKIYKQIVELVYMDLASYFFQAEITDLGVFGSITNDVIINYLCNFIMYEYLGLINWVISRSIGCMQNDKFIHRLATYMQHCLINKEVLCNADHS